MSLLGLSPRRVLAGVAAVGMLTSMAGAGAAVAVAAPTAPAAQPAQPDFGPNVMVFDPTMPTSQIQAAVDAVAAQQVDNEMGIQRYALLFKPGTYGSVATPLIVQVGYYTEVTGLGASPADVTINGHVDVYNRCLTPTNCIALDNFWRSVSNLTVNVMGGPTDCRKSADFWAVSQASPVRRVNITGGNLTLFDYCTAGPQFASGGFIADSKTGFVINGSQQQFLVRNSTIGGWSNGVWNQVFAGVIGAPPQSFPTPPYTTLATNPVSREKPYLDIDPSGNYNVFVPDPATNSSGTTWATGPTPGHSIPLSHFFVAKPTDSVDTINDQLARGKDLIFTPGVYNIDQSIQVTRPHTIVLGLGLATLTAASRDARGVIPITVGDVKGVDIAGLMIDAGPVNSPVLLQIGTRHDEGQAADPNQAADLSDPTGLQDVFFRVGGPHVGKATESLEVNTSNVVLDDIWAWRADHGTGVGWTVNTAHNGVVVNGDNVTATGLFVEHFQKYNVIWRGENGRTIFFQNELPYDPPNQAAWRHGDIIGWAAYKVADSVKTHELWGGGSYIFTNVDPTIHAAHGFEVPRTPGVQMHDLLTVDLGAGTIDHVINNVGAAVTPVPTGTPSDVVSYP